MLISPNKINLELNPHQLQLILESILFTACPEINHSLYKSEIRDLLDLAVEIRKNNQNIPTVNITLDKDLAISNEFTDLLTSYFPELENI